MRKLFILFLWICFFSEIVAGQSLGRITIANASSTGTTLNKLAKLTGAPSTAVNAATTDTGGVIGIVVAGAGISGTAVVQTSGLTSCIFDGATTANDYVQISSSSAAECHDTGSTSYPTSGQVLGRVLSTNGSGGTYTMNLFPAEISATAGSVGSVPCSDLPALTGDVTSSSGSCSTTIAANAVTSGKMAVVNTRRSCDVAIGDESGGAIGSGQLGPEKRLCYIPAPATIVEMDVSADAGTPNVIVGRNHAGTVANIVSAALATAGSGGIACSNTGGTTGIDGATTCTNTLQNTSLSAGDYLELVSGTAGGTAKLVTVHIIYTIN